MGLFFNGVSVDCVVLSEVLGSGIKGGGTGVGSIRVTMGNSRHLSIKHRGRH